MSSLYNLNNSYNEETEESLSSLNTNLSEDDILSIMAAMEGEYETPFDIKQYIETEQMLNSFQNIGRQYNNNAINNNWDNSDPLLGSNHRLESNNLNYNSIHSNNAHDTTNNNMILSYPTDDIIRELENIYIDSPDEYIDDELEDVPVPLPESLDNYGKLYTISNTKSKNTNSAVCRICYPSLPDENIEDIKADKWYHLLCGHDICTDCAKQWFQKSKKCPFCQNDLHDILRSSRFSKHI